ncbi:MAG TPA: N-acetylmuramoyl-L-alanine amidase [Candidatus Absconditabacterales bacterium]|nr:N-acetylmuramoyl-L-alanine amidase [Candidatus Absconditabacterales bacterium]
MKRIFKYKILFTLLIVNCTLSIIYAADRNLPDIDIISRAERGVDETMRLESHERFQSILQYRENYKKEMEALKDIDFDTYYQKYQADQESSYQSKMANDYLKDNYFDEIDLDWTNYTYGGQDLWRPEYHKDNKTKIIVHHTASDNSELKNKQDVIEYLSGVFYYHTLKHGRGDIGYNFLIDPFGNIYEGRAGGEGVVGAHAKWNNTPSIGISLIGNFDVQEPTVEALDSLIKLSTALTKKYNINPKSRVDYHRDSKEAPYILSEENYSIAGHRDAGITSCPGDNLYKLLPQIRDIVSSNLQGKTLASSSISSSSTQTKSKINNKLTYEYFQSIQHKIIPVIKSIKDKYLNEYGKPSPQSDFSKIKGNIDKIQATIYLNQDISVLLYELTQEYDIYDLSCDGGCVFVFDKNRIEAEEGSLQIGDEISLTIGQNFYNTDRVVVYSQNDLINIQNYDRKSYANIPRNTFHGAMIFKKDYIKNKAGVEDYKYLVINKLPFSQYLRGIVETNDTESLTKNKVMSLLAKSYALFYMHPENIHPNIPDTATYNAVDDPDIFQKYIGAGLENTLTKRYQALDSTQDQILLYQNIVPILPYFSCSAGFTYSASEKRGWSDTPYLKSKFDIGICKDKDFSGHGVGLSGLGAERRSKFGRSCQDILNYYYPGIQIENL